MSQHRPEIAIGLVRFYSAQEMAKYLKDLSEYYAKEAERYGDKLGSMLRGGPAQPVKDAKKQEKQEKGDKKADNKAKVGGGWTRMGPVLVSGGDSSTHTTEVMYQVHEELKQRLAKVNETVKSLEQNANSVFPKDASFLLFFKNGVPERIIIEGEAAKKAVFNFEGKFRVV